MITVITPTIPGREDLLVECRASVTAAGLPHLVALDAAGEGPSMVRNRLVAGAATEWVLFLDDDDVLLPTYRGVVAPHLPSADVVYTAYVVTGADDPPPHPFVPELLARRNFIPVTACVRKSAFDRVGGFVQSDMEDWELWKALLADGARFTYVPEIAWTYRRRPVSRSRL